MWTELRYRYCIVNATATLSNHKQSLLADQSKQISSRPRLLAFGKALSSFWTAKTQHYFSLFHHQGIYFLLETQTFVIICRHPDSHGDVIPALSCRTRICESGTDRVTFRHPLRVSVRDTFIIINKLGTVRTARIYPSLFPSTSHALQIRGLIDNNVTLSAISP